MDIPHNAEAEKNVLAAIINSDNCFSEMGKIEEDDFYDGLNRSVFKIVQSIYVENGKPVFSVMCDKAKTKEVIERISDIVIIPAAEFSYRENFNILKQHSYRRKILKATRLINDKMMEQEYDTTLDIKGDVLSLIDIPVGEEEQRKTNIQDIIFETVKEIGRRYQSKESEKMYYGFYDLDRITGGLHKQELTVIAARTGYGKTSIAIQIMVNLSLRGNICVLFSREMSNTQIAERILSNITGINSNKIRFAKTLTDADFKVLLDTQTAIYEDMPIYINDYASTTQEIRSFCREMKSKGTLDVIVIDYLQLCRTMKKTNTREREVAEMSWDCKMMAKEFNVPVILISQLNRLSAINEREPVLSDLRDSGCLSGETLIWCPQEQKLIQIKDMQNKGWVLSENNGQQAIADYIKCWQTGHKQTHEIILSNGSKIKATMEHKFLSESGWVQLKDIKPSEKIAIPVGYSKLIQNTDIPIEEIRFIGHMLSNGSAVSRQAIHYTANTLDRDLCYRVMGDAEIATKNTIEPKIKDYNTSRSKFSCVYFKPVKHLTHRVTSPVADILRQYGLYDVRAKQKFIPDKLMFLPFYETCQLLKSLFSGDGCAYYHEHKGRRSLKISYSSASEQLITGIRGLLASVGIIAFTRQLTRDKHIWYDLYIAGKSNIEIFVENIGFFNQRKQNIMLSGWDKSKSNIAGWTKYKFNNSRTLCYVPVKSITAGIEEDVYDITVPSSHCFMANGILAHNSVEQDADNVIFLYAEKETDQMQDEFDIDIILAKQRQGATGKIKLRYNKPTFKFMNIVDESKHAQQVRQYDKD